MSDNSQLLPKQSLTPFLLVLLVIASFVIGSLVTKVSYLEKTAQGTPTGVVAGVNTSATPAPTAPPAVPLTISKTDHIRGNKDAKITLVEYSDLECPYCKQFHPTMLELMNTYQDKIRWVYRHYPLSFHQNAQKEAEASECVAKLGGEDAFWKYIDTMYERTTSNGLGFALDKLGPLALEVGVNQQEFQTCLDTNTYTTRVANDVSDGSNRGINATPTTIIIGPKGETERIVGAQPISQLKTVIDRLLKS